MTTDAGDTLPVYLGLTDTPQDFNCVHQGIRYPGQVIVGNRWRREWGQPLEGDAYFRIVLLRSRRSLPKDALRDSRIVVCLPKGTSSRGEKDVDRELRTLRESGAQYGSPSDLRGTVIHEAFQRREGELQGQMKTMEAQRYADGALVSPADVSALDLGAVFSDSDPRSWCDALAARLLAWAYPEVALGPGGLPQPLVSEDADAILEEVLGWGEPGSPALARFGPALGLSTAERPGEFNPEGCPIFRRVEDLLESARGRLLWGGVHRLLAHADGLTSPLATLYLLAFVHHSRPEVEVGLRPDHGLTHRDGTIFRGDRVVREVASLVTWPRDVGTVAECIRKPAQLSWAGALPYVSRLVPKISDDPVEGDITLVQTLVLLAEAVDRCRDVVDRASRVLGADVEAVLARLSPLEGLSKAQGFVQAYTYARKELGSPDAVSQGLEYLYRVENLGKALPDLEEAVCYLKEGEIQGGHKNLSLMREALLAQLSPGHLLSQPTAPEAFTGQWESYRRDYATAYRQAHREYHDASPPLKARLEEAGASLRALGHLNSIAELGPPLGGDLEEGYSRLADALRSCDLGPQDQGQERRARCPSCALALGEEPPASGVEALLRDLDAALLEQNRRLSRELVGRILHGRADRRLEDLLKIVQASDLSSLANTLDGELVAFIRRLVSSP